MLLSRIGKCNSFQGTHILRVLLKGFLQRAASTRVIPLQEFSHRILQQHVRLSSSHEGLPDACPESFRVAGTQLREVSLKDHSQHVFLGSRRGIQQSQGRVRRIRQRQCLRQFKPRCQ